MGLEIYKLKERWIMWFYHMLEQFSSSFPSPSLFIPPQPPLPSPSSLKICDAGEAMGYRIFCESERKTEKIRKREEEKSHSSGKFYGK